MRSTLAQTDQPANKPHRIPYTTTRTGETIQDWDTLEAIDVRSLARTLAYVRENGVLPPRLRSIQDLNEASESGVSREEIGGLKEEVRGRLSAGGQGKGKGKTVVFMEGFLLYAPEPEGKAKEGLRAVHEEINLRLFLPAPYDLVKTRRESRTGYVTQGPAPIPPELPQRRSSLPPPSDVEVDLMQDEEGELPAQNFWVDPPGYVDDVVWPRYVRDHAWLLMGEDGEDLARVEDEDQVVRRAGQGVNVRGDVGVDVAPGKGELPMKEILRWAVDEVVKYCTI